MRPINILILVSTHVLLLTYAIEIIVPHEDVPPSTSGNRIGTAGEGGSSSSGEGCLGTSCGSHGISSEGEGGGNSIGDTTNPGNPARVPGSSSEDGPSESRINGSEVSEALEDIVEQVLSAVAGSSATSATSAPTPTAVAKSAGPNGQACITARSILSTCSVKTSGFLSAGNRVQASCLCYQPGRRSSSWVPDVFDDAISSCDRYVGTVTQLLPFRRRLLQREDSAHFWAM